MLALEFATRPIADVDELWNLIKVRDEFYDDEAAILGAIAFSGAVLKGHVELSSGQHSEYYFRSRNLTSNHNYDKLIAKLFIERFQQNRVRFDTILSPVTAGYCFSSSIVDSMERKKWNRFGGEVRRAVAKVDDHGYPINIGLNDQLSVDRRDHVLLTEAVLREGNSLRVLSLLAKAKGAELVAIACYVSANRQVSRQIEDDLGLKVYALADLALEDHTYPADDCPICPTGKKLVNGWNLM
ncbi:hypothetical protein HY385_02235 [Candidatus Daviesbacteria bacterium]|nr:hypothetical protein [Candidatus Daviesbacteria bacterium]